MNNFGFYILGNYSPNICTFGKCKSTCYKLTGLSKNIFLDFGAGVFFKFLNMVKSEKMDLNNTLFIISHNHVDHNLSLLFLAIYLYIYNFFHKEKKKVNILLPKKSIIYNLVLKAKGVYNSYILNESVNFTIDECNFSFCRTIHKGESYATKIKYKDKVFVYTSDLARYSKKLKRFVENADSVLIDAGYPTKLFSSFQNYHGKTKQIIEETCSLNVKTVFATHLRFLANFRDYINAFPKDKNVKLVKIDEYYQILN